MGEGRELTSSLGEYCDWPKSCGWCHGCDPVDVLGDGDGRDVLAQPECAKID